MDKKETVRAIKEALEMIPHNDYKIVLKLRLMGFKLKEMTKIIDSDKTDEAVRNDYKRGKKLLRDNLKLLGYTVK